MKAQGSGKGKITMESIQVCLGNKDGFYSTSFQEEFVSTNSSKSTPTKECKTVKHREKQRRINSPQQLVRIGQTRLATSLPVAGP